MACLTRSSDRAYEIAFDVDLFVRAPDASGQRRLRPRVVDGAPWLAHSRERRRAVVWHHDYPTVIATFPRTSPAARWRMASGTSASG